LLRRHGLSATACAVGGLAFALSGGMAQSVNSMIGQTLACAPWALLATCYFLDRPGPRRAAILALAYAAVALSSFPPMVVAVFFYAGVYALARLLADRSRGAWRATCAGALGWALASALAVALAAFYLLPVAALYRATPDVAKRYELAHELAIEPGNLLQLGSPLLLGGSKILVRPWVESTRAATEVPYVGAFALGLAAFAAGRGERRARALLWLAVATMVVIVAKGLGLPPLSWLTQQPPLSFVHFVPYFLHSLGLPVAILAALGWDSIERRAVTRLRAAGALLAGATWLTATWIVGDQRGAFDGPDSSAWLSEFAVLATLLMLPVALAVATRSSLTAGRRSAFVLALGLAVLTGEGIRNTWYPRQVRWDIWSHPHPMVATLQQEIGDGRLFAYHTFPANWGSAYGVPQLESLMAFNAPRSHDLYVAATTDGRNLFMNDASRLPSEPFLTRAAIRLVATSDRTPWTLQQIGQRRYRKIFDDGHTFVFRRRSASRFFFTSRYNVVDPDRAKKAAVSDLQVRRLWLEEHPGFGSRANRGATPRVEVLEFRNNGYRLRVRAPRPGLVYCSESQMPGWTARVNDRPARILAANYAFRAVAVGPGESVIELRYRPPGLRAGLWTSASALALVLVLVWLPSRRKSPAAT
ncbi:MAG TPA: YfhO family protein, partial [Thermoanaerobaculia bacterium]|nr:YfhO family protein [Thermoanaerobaculia bacterium]